MLDHNEAELQIPGYKIFRSDRKRINRSNRGRLSGGVATYVRDDIAANIEISLAFSNGVVEALCLYCKSNNFMIINLYRQPDVSSSKHRSTSSEFKSALNAISETLSSISPAPLISRHAYEVSEAGIVIDLFIISRHAYEVSEAGIVIDLFLLINNLLLQYSKLVRAVSLEPLGVRRSYFNTK